MGDYKTIEKELLGIGQAQLQDVVFQIIDKKYTPTNIVNLGAASGVQTTRKGTPDVYLQLSYGNYIFVEVTIQKTGLVSKIKKDIEKCKKNAAKLLDKNAGVEKVIFACVGKIETVELQECQNLCKEFCLNAETPFEFWGIDKLGALLLHEYQAIAVSDLNIKFSYGLVKTLDDYLKNDEYDVSQQHEFLFRESELADIENKLYEKNIVLLHGVAGCGKTRLCIHVAQKLKTQGQVKEIYYVKNAYYNGFDSLCAIAGKENTVIILDDVNRLPFIKEFIAYVQNHKNVYVLATVRDYALNAIATDLKNTNADKLLHFISISPLSKEQQENIIKKIIPKASYDTLTSIQNVAHENLRFAIMMAETLKKHGHLPTKMKELMERHFNRINSDLDSAITKDKNTVYIKALIVLAFFHRVVVDENDNNWEFINGALKRLGINNDDFYDAMAYWDRQEIVNISYEGKVYEIGDQILASYLFYKLAFEEKQIKLSCFFELFFPKYRKCFVDMFNSILPAYGYQNEIIMPQVTQLWNEVYKPKNNDESVQFISMFYGLLPIETLDFIKGHGEVLSDDFLDILCGFESSRYCNVAIDILINYIDNCQPNANIVEKIAEAFSIHRNSFLRNLDAQCYILRALSDRMQRNEICRGIFFNLSKKLLDFTFESTEFNYNSMVCFTMQAVPCDSLLNMRAIIWAGITKLYKAGYYKDINGLLERFRYIPNSKSLGRLQEILDNDQKTILPFVQLELKEQLTFAQQTTLKRLLETCCNDNNSDFKELVQILEGKSVDFKIYSQAFSRQRERRFDVNARANKYGKLFETINIPEDFFSYITALQSIEVGASVVSYAVEAYFSYVAKKHPKLLVDHLKQFIATFNNLDISYAQIAYILEEKCNLKELILFVQKACLFNKGLVLLELLQNLNCADISDDLYELCISTFKEEYCTRNVTTSRALRLSNFIEYEKYKAGFMLAIFQCIQDSNNTNISKYALLEDFYYAFNSKVWSYKDLTIDQVEKFFGNKLESVFYEMFFTVLQSNLLHTSGDFINYIASKNIEYLYRYYDFYFIHNDEFRFAQYLDIDALCQFPDVAKNMLIIYERGKKLSKYIIPVYAMKDIMSHNLNDETFYEFCDMFVDRYITEVKDLGNMASFLSSLKGNWHNIFVKILISKNLGVDVFDQINIFGHPSSWSGSDVAMYGKIIENIDALLLELDVTVDNISYIAKIKERRAMLMGYQARARLRELSDYRFFA